MARRILFTWNCPSRLRQEYALPVFPVHNLFIFDVIRRLTGWPGIPGTQVTVQPHSFPGEKQAPFMKAIRISALLFGLIQLCLGSSAFAAVGVTVHPARAALTLTE